MKTMIIAVFAFICNILSSNAQQPEAQKPVKTGNEWKMPGDVVQRSRHFADSLQKSLALDDEKTKKVFEIYMNNTKPVDEITVTSRTEKERKEKLKANHETFNEKLKNVLSPEEFQKYIRADAAKIK